MILTTYNGFSRGYLRLAIESVLTQSFTDLELIIIDDGSTDETKKLCDDYISNSCVKYVYQKNQGLAAARNKGIQESSFELICFLDDDDIWKKNKVQKQVDFIRSSSDEKLGMVYTHLELIDENGKTTGSQEHVSNGDIYEILFVENVVDAPSSSMIKKSVFEKVGLFKAWMRSCEDYELWFRIAREFSIYSINEQLVKYRVHTNKMSANDCKMEFYNQAALYYAFEGEEKLDKNIPYSKMYLKFALKHFRAENFAEFRKYFFISLGYKIPPLSFLLRFGVSFFPTFIKVIKTIRK